LVSERLSICWFSSLLAAARLALVAIRHVSSSGLLSVGRQDAEPATRLVWRECQSIWHPSANRQPAALVFFSLATRSYLERQWT
jgi:hypothetical protein